MIESQNRRKEYRGHYRAPLRQPPIVQGFCNLVVYVRQSLVLNQFDRLECIDDSQRVDNDLSYSTEDDRTRVGENWKNKIKVGQV